MGDSKGVMSHVESNEIYATLQLQGSSSSHTHTLSLLGPIAARCRLSKLLLLFV